MIYVPKRGFPRVDRRIRGVGRLRISHGTRDPEEINANNRLLNRLIKKRQLAVLRAIKAGELDLAELRQAQRDGKLSSRSLLALVRLNRPLWKAIDNTIPKLGRSEKTRERYRTSRKKLEALGKTYRLRRLGPEARVRDLLGVPWKALCRRWQGSAADWNHIVRMLSSVLTEYLGDVYHPFRRALMKRIPKLEEKPREPEIDVDTLLRILDVVPPHARPCYVTLAATGMRLGEYLQCTRDHLVPARCAVKIPGGKTGKDTVFADRSLWGWIEAGIPSPLKEKWLRLYWHRACVQLGLGHYLIDGAPYAGVLPTARDRRVLRALVQGAELVQPDPMYARYRLRRADGGDGGMVYGKDIRRLIARGWLTTAGTLTPEGRRLGGPWRYEGLHIHDLRHLFGYVAIDADVPESKLQKAMRHKDPRMTRRYVIRKEKGEVAAAVGGMLARRLAQWSRRHPPGRAERRAGGE